MTTPSEILRDAGEHEMTTNLVKLCGDVARYPTDCPKCGFDIREWYDRVYPQTKANLGRCAWCRNRGHYSVTVGNDPKPVEIICSHCHEGTKLIGVVTVDDLDAMAECTKCEDGLIESLVPGSESKTEIHPCTCPRGQERKEEREP